MRKLYRSLLFVPGNQWDKIQKASQLNSDAVILDLEDSVPAERKEEARGLVVKALREVNWKGKDRGVRINGLDTRFWALDLYEVAKEAPDFLVIPKVRDSTEIVAIDKILTSIEMYYGLKRIGFLVIIENAQGLNNAYKILKASDRIIGVNFGPFDFCADVGCEAREDILLVPKLMVAFVAAAAGVQAIDSVYLNFRDVEGLEREARLAKAMGYTGKMAIHPVQIDVINRVFTPSEDEVRHAEEVIKVYEEAVKRGIGAVGLEGRMIDEAIVKIAKRILMMAKKI